jgi:hypothetical protein
MSDVAGAPTPAPDAPSGPALGMPSFAETASERLTALKGDREFGARYLKGDADARNQMRTLLELAHGNLNEADQAALASSIKLERTPSIAAGEKARAAAEAQAAATTPNIPYAVTKDLTLQQQNDLRADISGWMSSLSLPPSTASTVLGRISSEGPKVSAMSPEDRAAWVARQDEMLNRSAGAGGKELADRWRADAAKLLGGSKYTAENSPILRDAYVVRHLAIAAANRK